MIDHAPMRASGQRGWVPALALLGLAMPLVAVLLSRAAGNVLALPSETADYRVTAAALVVGIASSIVALLGSRSLPAFWRRRLVMAAAAVGMLAAAGHRYVPPLRNPSDVAPPPAAYPTGILSSC